MNEILTKDDYLLTSFSINRNQLFVELLKDNLKCSIDMLILDIKNSIRDIINNLERTKTNLESDLSSKQYELNKLENINNMSVEGFGNKGKKKFKKERTLLNEKILNTNILFSLKQTILNLNEKIGSIKEQISIKQNELEQFEKNCTNLTIAELCQLQSNPKTFNLGYSLKKHTKKGLNNINGIRQYHSYSRYYSTDIKKLNFNIDSPVYLELQRIINNSILDKDTQMKIEQF